jgi:hypothetical protein
LADVAISWFVIPAKAGIQNYLLNFQLFYCSTFSRSVCLPRKVYLPFVWQAFTWAQTHRLCIKLKKSDTDSAKRSGGQVTRI